MRLAVKILVLLLGICLGCSQAAAESSSSKPAKTTAANKSKKSKAKKSTANKTAAKSTAVAKTDTPAAPAEPLKTQSGPVLLDVVLASINGEPVTLLELQRHLKDIGVPGADQLRAETPELPRVLQEYLLSRMVERDAEEAGITVSNEEIEAYVKEIQRQNGVDEQGLDDLLKSKGLSKEQYLRQVRGDILKSRVIAAKVRSQVTVVDEEIARYVDEHPELKSQKGSIQLQQVRMPLPKTESDAEQVREEMKKTREKLASGGNLDDVPAQFAQDLGFLKAEDLRREIASAVSGLSSGEVSEIVEFGGAAYVFRVVSSAGEEGAVDAKTRERIKSELFQNKFEARLRTYLDEEMPKKHQIEFIR